MNSFLWYAYPYIALGVFVGGHYWRWRVDQLGISTRSSQLVERKWLLRGSIPFHVGLLGVFAGHVVGMLIPESLTEKLGMSEHVYHLQALALGGLMGFVCWSGILILSCRRLFIPAVRRTGNVADIVTDLMLLTVITLGMCLTIGYQLFIHPYNYRETISPWVRGVLWFHPDPSLMVSVPWIYKAHILAAFTLFLFWPFSRLVHVWTAPVQYVLRGSHILYRPAPPVGTNGGAPGEAYEARVRKAFRNPERILPSERQERELERTPR